METQPLRALGPRVDVHAHPGRCFLDDRPRTDPFLAGYRPVMTRYAQFDELQNSLAARGLTDKDINRVLGGNAIELVRTVCG
jgi:hypothetical protein